MSRDFAHTNTTIWNDDDWRALPYPAQHLYQMLWTHPSLTYCGVADWRPARLAPMAGGLSVDLIERLADCLESRHFIVRDDDSEEVLLRSWVRFDGLMRKPRMSISWVKAYAATSSHTIRGVVVSEGLKLRDREPDLACWTDDRVLDVLSQNAIPVRDLPAVCDPFEGLFADDLRSVCDPFAANATSGLRSVYTPPTHSPAHAPYSGSLPTGDAAQSTANTRGMRIPEGWEPSDELRRQMTAERPEVNIDAEVLKFVDYWKAKTGKDATKLDWPATFRNWIRNARVEQPRSRPGGFDLSAAMSRAEAREAQRGLTA